MEKHTTCLGGRRISARSLPLYILVIFGLLAVFGLFFLKNTHREITEVHRNSPANTINTCHADTIGPATSGKYQL